MSEYASTREAMPSLRWVVRAGQRVLQSGGRVTHYGEHGTLLRQCLEWQDVPTVIDAAVAVFVAPVVKAVCALRLVMTDQHRNHVTAEIVRRLAPLGNARGDNAARVAFDAAISALADPRWDSEDKPAGWNPTLPPSTDAGEATPRESALLALLRQARMWGITSKGYDASVAISVAREVDALATRPAQPAWDGVTALVEEWYESARKSPQGIDGLSSEHVYRRILCDCARELERALATPTAGDAT